ncbi:helix-turn-helix transcriptional regulator [Burkholderia lata]|uniref:helix-turn-helix transcriptional regulator n=1 Tax=Burkholderia lata (strain ATCC 17760 / DSM 23089 / LMG 22485 / NCIMB 9086 / R18194 / 383) TaxID=482957 RepID=UPI0030029C26
MAIGFLFLRVRLPCLAFAIRFRCTSTVKKYRYTLSFRSVMLAVRVRTQELMSSDQGKVPMKICLSLKEVAQALSLSPSTVQQLVREKVFPEPRLLSGRRVAWLVHEVQRWADARPVAKLLPPENSGAKKHRADRHLS